MHPVILLADDHIMITKGLRKSIELEFGYKDINSVTSCSEIFRELKKKSYTHIIMDMGLSDGSALEILPNIQSLYPGLRIMIFSAKPAAAYHKALKQLGIHGYLSKEQGEEETTNTLLKFLQNEVISPWNGDIYNNPFSILTAGEMEVLYYIIKGFGTNEVSTSLNKSASTVSTVKMRILDKTKCRNVKELIELAEAHNVK